MESAIKSAMYSRNFKKKIISFVNSFHGINSYGGIISDRVLSSTKKRLNKFPVIIMKIICVSILRIFILIKLIL